MGTRPAVGNGKAAAHGASRVVGHDASEAWTVPGTRTDHNIRPVLPAVPERTGVAGPGRRQIVPGANGSPETAGAAHDLCMKVDHSDQSRPGASVNGGQERRTQPNRQPQTVRGVNDRPETAGAAYGEEAADQSRGSAVDQPPAAM